MTDDFEVLPASAGMILPWSEPLMAMPCAPHIRGDDPFSGYLTDGRKMCSPHPRG